MSRQPRPELLLSVTEGVLVERHQFYLCTRGSPRPFEFKTPDSLMVAGDGAAVFLSGGTDHIATVTLEISSAEPEPNTREPWELSEQGVLQTDVVTLVFMGGNGVKGRSHQIPAPGSYGIRSYCSGRSAAEDAEIGDDLTYPAGLERWLIQLWFLQDSANRES